MSYQEIGGFPAVIKLAGFDAKFMADGKALEGVSGAWFEGFFTGEVRTWASADGKTVKTLLLLGIQMGDGAHVVSRSEGGKYYEHEFVPGEEYALRLGTVLANRLKKLLDDPARYEGAKLKVTFEKWSKAKSGQNPAAVYKTEWDVSTVHAAPDSPADNEAPEPEE